MNVYHPEANVEDSCVGSFCLFLKDVKLLDRYKNIKCSFFILFFYSLFVNSFFIAYVLYIFVLIKELKDYHVLYDIHKARNIHRGNNASE